MASFIKKVTGSHSRSTHEAPRSKRTKASAVEFFRIKYESTAVDIPADFLSAAPDAKEGPVISTRIDFAETDLPEYKKCYAVVLDNVLSAEECSRLLELAEASVVRIVDGDGTPVQSESEHAGQESWRPALVNAGPGLEVLDTQYRNSDRIIWDHPELVERLWKRCCLAEGVQDDLKEVVLNRSKVKNGGVKEVGEVWKVTKLNERMRFLRYGPGQFFRPHCDAPYRVPGKAERTFYTLHLYLSDSVQELSKGKSGKELAHLMKTTTGGDLVKKKLCKGGATTFHSHELERRLDVDPKIGRVLIFQHQSLLHSGDEVEDGVKYTMRTDLQFEMVASS